MTNQQEQTPNEFWQTVDNHLIRYAGSFSPVIIHSASGSYIYDRTGRGILDQALKDCLNDKVL